MSLFPPSLWVPAEKDLHSDFAPQQGIFLGGSSSASAVIVGIIGVNIDGSPQVPLDKVMLVSSVFCVAVPGAAQNVTRVRLQVGYLNPALSFIALGDLASTGTIAPAALAQIALDWQPGPPGFPLHAKQAIAVIADFNAGAAANTVSLSMVGAVIPRGNWQRA